MIYSIKYKNIKTIEDISFYEDTSRVEIIFLTASKVNISVNKFKDFTEEDLSKLVTDISGVLENGSTAIFNITTLEDSLNLNNITSLCNISRTIKALFGNRCSITVDTELTPYQFNQLHIPDKLFIDDIIFNQ